MRQSLKAELFRYDNYLKERLDIGLLGLVYTVLTCHSKHKLTNTKVDNSRDQQL